MHHCRSVLLHQINVKIDHIFNDLSQRDLKVRSHDAILHPIFHPIHFQLKSYRVTTSTIDSQLAYLSNSIENRRKLNQCQSSETSCGRTFNDHVIFNFTFMFLWLYFWDMITKNIHLFYSFLKYVYM